MDLQNSVSNIKKVEDLNRRICFFNTTQAWGGGEKWHLEIAQWLAPQTALVLAITNAQSELHKRFLHTPVQLEPMRVGKFSFLNPFKVRQIARVLRKHQIDTIIMNLSSDMKVAGLAAKLAGVSHIIYRRGSAIPVKNSFINRYFFKNVITNILANSEETKRTILQNNASLFPAEKITVIYNGLDIDKFDKQAITKSFVRQPNEWIIGNAGRLEKQKNQEALIRIARILTDKNMSFKIRIAGDGKRKQELIELAKQMNVLDKIEFIGFVENIKDFTESIDIFVLTSFWEGFGYVLVEAMLSAKPIVAFAVSSNPEIVADKQTGFLIPDLDEQKMAEKLEELMINKALQQQFGQEGRQRAEKLFDIKNTYKKINNYLGL